MKRKMKLGMMLLAMCGIIASASAMQRTYGDHLVNSTALAYSTNVVINLDKIDTLAMQAIYSTATLTTGTFKDGVASTGTFTVGSTTPVRGVRLAINGIPITEGVDFTALTTTTGTASAICTALNANSNITAIITSTWTAGSSVVYSTAVIAGTAGNYTMYTSSYAYISTAGFTTGVLSNVVTASSSVYIATHGFTTGFPVLFTTTAGTAPGMLVTGTTYYAIAYDANHVQFATTSALALSGVAVGISTQTVLGGGTFTVAPLAWSGSASFKWQASNDNVNFFDLPLSSTTITSATTATNFMWDGEIYYRYLRFVYVAPTYGGLAIDVIGNGKQKQ